MDHVARVKYVKFKVCLKCVRSKYKFSNYMVKH